ncbi:hypothetical protein Q9966_003528 [Columba livia]|nr:hypothetical protein Q9966_003528 [Columba livia]
MPVLSRKFGHRLEAEILITPSARSMKRLYQTLAVYCGDSCFGTACTAAETISIGAVGFINQEVSWGTGKSCVDEIRFYNWDRNVSTSNSSPNYEVIAEDASGLLFKNKSDRKIINVDPKGYPGDNTTRTPVETDLYFHVVFYDHIIRRGT